MFERRKIANEYVAKWNFLATLLWFLSNISNKLGLILTTFFKSLQDDGPYLHFTFHCSRIMKLISQELS